MNQICTNKEQSSRLLEGRDKTGDGGHGFTIC
mgnify:CR=1 FL=1